MQYNQFIDHTLLKSNATKEDIRLICEEAKQYQFASVCINPTWVSYCAELLKDSPVKVCTVIGFPLGANTSKVKGFEAQQAVKEGADEVDMVINVGALKGQQYDVVLEDIKEVVKNANGKLVKVIIETCYLTDAEKVKACELAMQAHANFVKTSTGFGTGGATVADVALMKSVVKDELKVKASGGVRTYEDMVKMIEAGASRIGTSSGPKLVAKEDSNTAY